MKSSFPKSMIAKNNKQVRIQQAENILPDLRNKICYSRIEEHEMWRN